MAAELAESDTPKECVELKESVRVSEGKILRLVPSVDGEQNCFRVSNLHKPSNGFRPLCVGKLAFKFKGRRVKSDKTIQKPPFPRETLGVLNWLRRNLGYR